MKKLPIFLFFCFLAFPAHSWVHGSSDEEVTEIDVVLNNQSAHGIKIRYIEEDGISSGVDKTTEITVEPNETASLAGKVDVNYTLRVALVEPEDSIAVSTSFTAGESDIEFNIADDSTSPSLLSLTRVGDAVAMAREVSVMFASTGLLSLMFLVGRRLGRAPRRDEQLGS